MDKNKFSFKKILIDYWQVGKHYPVAFWGTFIFWSLGVTASSVVIPVYYKKITDAVALGNVQDTFHFIWVAFFIMIFFTIMFRIGDYFQINFQLNSIRDLHNVGLGRLLKHSHGFFANQFSGGLVTKLKRYTGSFEIIHDIFFYPDSRYYFCTF